MRLIPSGTWPEKLEGLSDRNCPGHVTSTEVRADKRSNFLKPKPLFPLLLAFVSGFVATQGGFAESLTNIDLRGTNQQLHLYGSRGGIPVILSSGDLGW